jgi:PKD repeat protein
VPTGVWSEEYDGAYLYADFAFGKIYLMKDNGTPECRTCDPPISNKEVSDIAEHIQIVNLGFGPYGNTQALYFSTVFEIRRITYVGDGNRSPYAIILAEPTSGQVGMEVMFSAAGSTDPDGDGLSFEWDFDGDSVVDSTLPNPTYAYNAPGLYNAALTVTDDQGGSHTVSIEISVGNKPIPVIVSPVAGTTFAVGDLLTLTGVATDVENGELTDMSLTWEVRQHHGTHYHPFLSSVTGNDIVLQPAPEPEDYIAASISYLEILLTATDADGLSDTVTLDVLPRLVNVDFATEPSGLEIFLDGTSLITPETATTWENHNLRVNAPDQFVDGQGYAWSAWSDGLAQSHTIAIPAASGTTPKFVAQFDDFFGTFAPTASPNPGSFCTPGTLGIVAWKLDLIQGEVFINTEFGTYTEQQNDGNLVVRKGTPDDPGKLVWESGYSGDVGNYFTRVLGNSNMLTYQGTPSAAVEEEAPAPVVWQTGTLDVDWDGNYFFGIDCTGTVVAVYQGYLDNPMNVVWQSAPFPGAAATPTMAPVTGIVSSPTNAGSVRTPGSLGIVAWASELAQGEGFNNTEFGVYAEQQDDGNLVVWRGTPDDQGELLWESGFAGEVGNYFTRVLSNSNMITYKGTLPEDIEAEVWQTGTEEFVDPDGLYFFGIDGTSTVVAVYPGTPDNAGAAVWKSAVMAEVDTDSPTMAPTVVGDTFAPSTMVAPSAPFAPTNTSAPSVSTSISGTSVPTKSPTMSPSTSVSTLAPSSRSGSAGSSLSSSVTLNAFIGMLLPLSLLHWLLL